MHKFGSHFSLAYFAIVYEIWLGGASKIAKRQVDPSKVPTKFYAGLYWWDGQFIQ